MIRFLIDAPQALARWLGENSFSARSVRELGLRDSDDGSIWNFAVEGNWTVITKDEDFVARCAREPSPPRVVWLRIGNVTNRVLFAALTPTLPDIIERLERGERTIE